jgi:glutaconate CoA-transferase subunit A
MADKRRSLAGVVATIESGSRIALGGNTLHRAPAAAVHELARQRTCNLELVKTAGAYDVDLLCGLGLVSAVSAGYVGYETVFGLAPSYRRAVEGGAVEAREHACYTIIAGLRAAAQGVPFMPLNGLQGSDLPALRGFATVRDPYSGLEVVAVPSIAPDVAFIHVQEADVEGNGRIWGSVFEDTLMVRAAKRVILTAERIVDGATFAAEPDRTDVPGFLVEAVVEAPGGAWPTSCAGLYPYDEAVLGGLVRAAGRDDALRRYAEGILRVDPAWAARRLAEAEAEGSRLANRIVTDGALREGTAGSAVSSESASTVAR